MAGSPRRPKTFDHRYGLKDYALTYSGLFILENSMKYDSDELGIPAATETLESEGPFGIFSMLALIPIGVVARRRWKR